MAGGEYRRRSLNDRGSEPQRLSSTVQQSFGVGDAPQKLLIRYPPRPSSQTLDPLSWLVYLMSDLSCARNH